MNNFIVYEQPVAEILETFLNVNIFTKKLIHHYL